MYKALVVLATLAASTCCTCLTSNCFAQDKPATTTKILPHGNPKPMIIKTPASVLQIGDGLAAKSVCIQNNYAGYTVEVEWKVNGTAYTESLQPSQKSYLAPTTAGAGQLPVVIWLEGHKTPVYKFTLAKGHCYQVFYNSATKAVAIALMPAQQL